VRVISQKLTRSGEHLQATLAHHNISLKAIAWRWHQYFPLPPIVDIAYQLKENEWQGEKSIQLELIGIRQAA
jgi:single-stranded-DNA-specific exonuclease